MVDQWDPHPQGKPRSRTRIGSLGALAVALVALGCCGSLAWLADFLNARLDFLMHMP